MISGESIMSGGWNVVLPSLSPASVLAAKSCLPDNVLETVLSC